MKTRKRLANNPQKETLVADRICVRNRTVVFKESEAEETIPVESIPLIEEIMADLFFASWLSERSGLSNPNKTQMEKKNDESDPIETNLTA